MNGSAVELGIPFLVYRNYLCGEAVVTILVVSPSGGGSKVKMVLFRLGLNGHQTHLNKYYAKLLVLCACNIRGRISDCIGSKSRHFSYPSPKGQGFDYAVIVKNTSWQRILPCSKFLFVSFQGFEA